MRICLWVVHHPGMKRNLLRWVTGTLIAAGLISGVAAQRQETDSLLLLDWLIAIDAGHGGNDKGAWFPAYGLVEKEINLDVAKNLGQLLARDGASVILIREDDTFIHLAERARKANEAHARMFISIHVNRYPQDRTCCGAQVFYPPDSARGKHLAMIVQKHLRSIDPLNRREALSGNYKVLRDTHMPAILIEIGFATNARDRELLLSQQFRSNAIYAIRKGILEYAQSL